MATAMMTLEQFREMTDMFPGDSLLVIDNSKGRPTLVIAKPLGRCYDIEIRSSRLPQDEIDDLVDVFTTPPKRKY